MSNVIDLPVKDITYHINGCERIFCVSANIDNVDIDFLRSSKEKHLITQLCIVWLALEKPEVLLFDSQED